MRIVIDTDSRTLIMDEAGQPAQLDLYTTRAFEVLSHVWLKVGWNRKYPYTFSWLSRPIIQLPEDMVRTQEVIYRLKPDVIIETGIAHGGSLIFYASLCHLLGRGRVIGVDIEIRPHNRRALEAHELYRYLTLIEGDSVAPAIVQQVRALVLPGETALVLLDSNHTKAHVRAELEAYHTLVTPRSYIVATDGIMQELHDVPRGRPEWAWDNPAAAAREFLAEHPEFLLEQPASPFNESDLRQSITHWPGAWLRRR